MTRIWHEVEEPMLLLVHSGSGSAVFRSGARPFGRGTLIFVDRGVLHFTVPDVPEEYVRSKIYSPPESFPALKRIMELECGGFGIAYLSPEDLERAEALFCEAGRFVSDPRRAAAALTASFCGLLVLLDADASESAPLPRGSVGEAMEFINSNISSPLTLETVCEAVHLSKYHFCRKFKSAAGISVTQYILRTRLELAKEALKNGDLSVTRIAEDCGFSGISDFDRRFKSAVGMSPGKYRRLFEKGRSGD